MGPERGSAAGEPLPRRIHLPSGRAVTLDARAAGRAADSLGLAQAPPLARAARLVASGGWVRDDAGAVDVGGLELRDALVLIALVFRAGLVEERIVTAPCINCDRTVRARPSERLEIGPFLDGELHDPELDAPFVFDEPHPIPQVFTGSGVARSVRFAPRTFGQSKILFEARSATTELRPAHVIALGIVALGRERNVAAITRSLSRAGDEVWTAVAEGWEDAHVHRRLIADVFCECGARNEMVAPADSPLDTIAEAIQPAPNAAAAASFLSEEEFEAEVERARSRVYAVRGVRNLPLVVDVGVPACDDGGEPLLGSYLPPGSDILEDGAAEIRLYYRTFQAEALDNPAFDVKGEIFETIDHEVEHHLYFLRGDDPMDAEERATIARERTRVVGKKEVGRRTLRAVFGDLYGFVTKAFPLLLLLVVLWVVRECSN